MSNSGLGADTTAAFRSFVTRLDADPQATVILARFEHGHEPDSSGWCSHPLHTLTNHHELHPCSTTQLVTAIRAAEPRAS